MFSFKFTGAATQYTDYSTRPHGVSCAIILNSKAMMETGWGRVIKEEAPDQRDPTVSEKKKDS